MLSLSAHRQTCIRLTRALALVALLCVVGVQVLEAGHMHDLGERSSECVLCKSTPVLASMVAATLLVLALAVAERPGRRRLAAPSAQFHPRQTRGPPSHS